MNINRDDLNGLQSAYRTVLTESQETGHNGGMNNQPATLDVWGEDGKYKQEIKKVINSNDEAEQPAWGFGEDERGMYRVDLYDDEQQHHAKHYIKPGLSYKQIVELGLKSGVLTNADGEVKVDVEFDDAPEQDAFLQQIHA
jgi:hypothetical protein